MRPVRPLVRLLPLLLAGWLGFVPASAEGVLTDADKVKLAYLFNFAKLTDWPQREPGGPLVVCLAIDEPVFHAMLEAARGRFAAGRPLHLRRLAEVRHPGECHILFVARDRREALDPAVYTAAGVLTVGEQDHFTDHGVVRLFPADGRLRFEVNLDAARRAGVQLSARLLSLAKVVGDGD